MTDNEIIKALECYLGVQVPCSSCEYKSEFSCRKAMEKDALDLINRQKAKIEALLMDNSQLQTDNFNAIENAKDLSVAVEIWKEIARREANYVDVAKAKAIKEFAEMLKKFAYTSQDWSHGEHPCVVEVEDIDNLVQDMAGKNAFERSKAE